MIYLVYFFIGVGVILLAFFLSQWLSNFEQKQNLKKIVKQYNPTEIAKATSFINNDGKISSEAQTLINDVRSLETSKDKKQTFIEKMTYKLNYVYGSKPLQNFIRLYIMSGLCFGGILYYINVNYIIIALTSAVIGLFGAIILANRAFDRKIAHFLNHFVYAIDIMARGVRSGLSINLCYRQVVQDIDIVVGEQFLALLDDYRLGLTTDQVMDRFMNRFPLKEVKFFCLSIMIQSKTGGNLADILTNLAKILRNRKTVLLKIQTLSSEARTSAKVMGSLPICVLGLLKLTASEYVDVLINTPNGHLVLLGCGMWMLIGALVMRKMINFYQ